MNSLTACLIAACLCPGQVKCLDVAGFAKDQQLAAALATVHIRNESKSREGSGVIIAKSTSAIYILTAQHLIDGGERLQVAVFTERSYPRPHKTYASAKKVAAEGGLTDLGLLRLAIDNDLPSMLRVCPEAKIPKETPLTLLSVGCDIGTAPTLRHEKNVAKKLARRPGTSEQAPFWEVQEKYPSGRSGGPLVDKHGFVLGVCSGTNRDRTYFTHASEIHRFLKKHGYRWIVDEKVD